MDTGAIAHALLLEGENIAVVIDAPDYRTKAAREARDAARAAGKVPIKIAQMSPIEDMLTALREQLAAHKDAHNAFSDGWPETTLVWQEPSNGVWCRARLDWLHKSHACVDDYKTTGGSASPDVLTRKVFTDGWDVQAAFYLRGLRMLDPECEPKFRFVVQETERPFGVCVIGLNEHALECAARKVDYAINEWGHCLRHDQWPGYTNRTAIVELPQFEEQRWLAKEAEL